MRVQGLETGWGKRQGAGCCEAGRLPEVRSCGRERRQGAGGAGWGGEGA